MPSCQPLFGRKSSKMCHDHFNPALLISQDHVESSDRHVIRKCFYGRMMRNGEYDDLEVWRDCDYIYSAHADLEISQIHQQCITVLDRLCTSVII